MGVLTSGWPVQRWASATRRTGGSPTPCPRRRYRCEW